VKLNVTEIKVLHHLATECSPEHCPSTSRIAIGVDLSMLAARRAIKSLHRHKLANLHRTFDDEGMCAGSGYEITDAGRAALAEQKDRTNG